MSVEYSVQYAGASDLPSPNIFKRLEEKAAAQKGAVIEIFDDFLDTPLTGGRWTLVETDDNATISRLADEVNGVVSLATTTDDNEEAYMDTGEAGLFKFTAGVEVGFEVRLKVNSIADNVTAFFVGVGEESSAAANYLTDDTGEPASKDYVGFLKLHADGDSIDAVHRTAGGSKVTVIDGAATPVADTFIKLGVHCSEDGEVSFFVDGVKQSTTTTISATDFPDGEELGIVFGVKAGSAATTGLEIDYVRLMADRGDTRSAASTGF